MILFVRADATTQIGTGHVMRCIALGQAWQEKGGQVIFLSHWESEALKTRIIAEGFDLIPIKNPHPHADDLEKTLEILKRYALCSLPRAAKQNRHAPCSMPYAPTWLALDGYQFTPDYQKAIKDAGHRLLVIDDMAHLGYYYADIVLNQNIHAGTLDYPCEPYTRLLLGTKYVLLRREFWRWRDWKRHIPGKAKKILVTMGGSDPDNVTLKVIETIKLLNDPILEVKILVGLSNPHASELRNAMLHAPCSMLCVENATNMPALMAWADVAISAAGSTCWETAFMGLPTILIVIAQNQLDISVLLAKSGFAECIGVLDDFNCDAATKKIVEVATDCQLRQEMSFRQRNLVDGYGTTRVLNGLGLQ